jgi:Ni,Fe-hydrogenase I cytochrome b subunit
MLYSRSMNKVLTIAVVACVILFIITVFISPMVDMQPSALRAQQWLSFIFAIFAMVLSFVVRFELVPALAGPRTSAVPGERRAKFADLTCCLLC